MINEEWKKKTQMMPPFGPLCNMGAVSYVLPHEIADVCVAGQLGLQWFILIPQLKLNHIDSQAK